MSSWDVVPPVNTGDVEVSVSRPTAALKGYTSVGSTVPIDPDELIEDGLLMAQEIARYRDIPSASFMLLDDE